MQRRPNSCHVLSINHALSQKTDTTLAKSLLVRSQQKKSWTSPTSTNDMQQSSQNRSPKGCQNIQYGTTLSNFSQAHLAHYQDVCYLSHRKKLQRQRSLWKNIYNETQSDHHGAPMQPTSSSSKRKMANSNQSKIINHWINGRRKTETSPLSSHQWLTDSQGAPCSPSLISDGGIITFASN